MIITQYKKKDGKTYYRVQGYIGTCLDTGKEIHISRSGFSTEREAKKEFARLLLEFENGQSINKSTIAYTFIELYHEWLILYKETVKESTYYKTKQIFRDHILPVFGSMNIKAIDTIKVQRAVNDWCKRYVKYVAIKNYASNVFKYAQRLGIVEKNPFDLVIMPKRKEDPNKETKENFYSREELKEFLNTMKDDNPMWATFFWLLAYTGIRKGEALALKWSDLDLKNKTLSITKTVTIGKDHKQIIQSPKTQSGKRLINLDSVTMKVLTKWNKEQYGLLTGFGLPFRGNRLMFSNNDFELLVLSAPAHYLDRFYKKYPHIKRITTHGLRHTHCSLLFEAGATVKEVQDRLGHNDIHTTMNIYAHVTQGKKEETANLFMNYMSV